jgi:2'-hydroxyisoflavone reductase
MVDYCPDFKQPDLDYMNNRRQFIEGAMAALVGAEAASRFGSAQVTPASSTSLRILILGGTNYIGPHYVRTAVSRGHKVSVFNRGKTKADLSPTVERLIGDRNGDLRSIENREWDAVIDLQTLSPGWIRTLGRALRGRVKHYTFISSVALYAENVGIVDENSALLQLEDNVDPYRAQPSTHPQYRSFKVICEREAEAQFPRIALVIRPTVISGPEDPAHWIGYWLGRMRKSGEIAAPGDPLAPVQYIDAFDLAEWNVSMVERGETGAYNAAGPSMPMGMGELLGAARSMFSIPTRLTWIPSHWLIAQGIKSGQASIFWVRPPDLAEPDAVWLSYKVSCEKAIAKGLSFRPLATTLQDILTWYKDLPSERQAELETAWKPKSEQQVLSEWHNYQGTVGASEVECAHG